MIRQSLLKNARISVWILATLATCGMLVSLFTITMLGAGRQMSGALRRMGANAVAYPATTSPKPGMRGNAVNWSAVQQVAYRQGASVVSIEVHVGLVTGKPVAVAAADPAELESLTPFWRVTGRRPSGPGECLVGRRLAEVLHLTAGSKVQINWANPGATKTYQVVGISDTGDEDENRLWITSLSGPMVSLPAQPARLPPGHPSIAGMDPGVPHDCRACHQQIPQPAEDIAQRQSIAAYTPSSQAQVGSVFTYALLSVPAGESGIVGLQTALGARGIPLELRPLRQILHGEQSVLDKISLLMGLSLTAVIALTSLGISAAMLARITERRKELALLQALGASRPSVVVFLLAESATLGIVAAVLGYLGGTLLALIVFHRIFHVIIHPSGLTLFITLGVTVTVALIAGVTGALRALRLQPSMALRGE